jgi:hypothetical protein
MTADSLEDLAKEGSRQAFEAVLAKVPDVEPDPWDQWTLPDQEQRVSQPKNPVSRLNWRNHGRAEG